MNARSKAVPFLLCAGALGLASACSHEEPPPRTQSSPTFESNLPAPEQQRSPVIPLAPADSNPPKAAPVAEPPEPAAPTPPPRANERQLCDELGREAKVTVKDAQGGAIVTATPRNGASLASVQRDANRIVEAMMEAKRGPTELTGDTGERCVLFDIGRRGGGVTVSDAGDSIQLTLTITDPTGVKSVRSQARQYVKAMAANLLTEGKDLPTTHDVTGEPRKDPGDAGRGSTKDKPPGQTPAPQKITP